MAGRVPPTVLPVPTTWRRIGAATLPVVLLLSGCGLFEIEGPGAASPSLSPRPTESPSQSPSESRQEQPDLARFYEQPVRWSGCRSGLECAEIEVPLDYAAPDGEVITLSLLKDPADDDGRRVGSLVVNPGGPGGSGVDYAANAEAYFRPDLRAAFDIVGFDPRGVGASTPVDCLPDAELDEFVASDPDPDTAEEVANADRMIAEFGAGCLARSGDLTRHVSTMEAARDVDIIRELVGDRRLNWFGASYGTLLGAAYADLFPDRVGRMVLDGAIDPTLSSVDMGLVQAHGFEVALRAYVGACVKRGGCFLGDTVDEGTQRIRRFLDEVEADPISGSGGRDLEVGHAVLGIWAPLYASDYWPTLDEALRSGFEGRGGLLMRLADAYTSRGPDGYTDNSLEVLYAVNCLDQEDPLPSSEVPALVPRFEEASPTFGAIFAYGLSSCAQWPVQASQPVGRFTAAGAAPILVVGTTRDPATPLEWAEALAAQLESGVLVARDGDGHTGYNAGNRCVDEAVESYLVSGVVPKSDLTC